MADNPRTQSERQRVNLASADPNAARLDALKDLFPEAFAEGRVDFDKLRAALGESVDDAPERYSFWWAGKSDAIRILQTPTRARLSPCVEESVDWETTRNLFLEGDNLEVLKLLYKAYFGRVKMIYIDPPYNTGHDFVYPDNYADPLATYLELTGQQDAEGNLLTSNPETSGRYHSAWLSMMYPRLFLARQLLREDGVIFISIDDNEVHNLRMVMNEIFGEENFIAQITWKNVYGGGAKSKHVVPQNEYIMLYARSKESIEIIELPPDPKARKRYTERDNKYPKRGPYFTQPLATTSMDTRPNLRFPIPWQGEEILPEKQWQWSKDRVMKALENDDLVIRKDESNGKWSVRYKQYLKDEEGNERGSKLFSVLHGPWTQVGTGEITDLFGDGKVFNFPKPTELVKHLISCLWRDESSIVLDFFSGSSVTAQAVLDLNIDHKLNHRFIMVQLPEPTGREDFPTIADIGKERIRRVIDKIRKEREAKAAEAEGELFDNGAPPHEPDLGFRVYKLAPSTCRPWRHTLLEDPERFDAFETQLEEHLDPIERGARPDDILWEVALKEGFGLSSTVSDEPLGEKTVHVVHDADKNQRLRICLEDRLTLDDARALSLDRTDLFVCRDRAIDDEVAANLALQCRLKTI